MKNALATYILFEQSEPAAVVHQRTDQGFRRAVYTGLDAVIRLPEIHSQLALSDVYEAVEFVSESSEDYTVGK